MKKISYLNYSRIADKALEFVDDGEKVSIVDTYDSIKMILHRLLRNQDLNIVSIELETPELDGYEKEYLLSIEDSGDIWVEKLYVDGRYLSYATDVVFINEDADLNSLALLNSAHIIQYSVTNM